MLTEDNENETTLRLLYYPPVIQEDDNKCEMAKGRCKYSQQHCNGNGLDLHLTPPKESVNGKTGEKIEEKPVENGVVNGADTKAEAAAEDDEKTSSKTEKKICENNVTRCGAHCDYGTFTLLSQDSEGGLEVKLPGTHKWARVGHLPGAILINTGEILSMWSQERYPALEHRVVIPQQENLRVRGRHSIAFFCHPDNCTEINPIDIPIIEAPICDKTRKLKRRSFKAAKDKVYTAYQLIQQKFKQTYVA